MLAPLKLGRATLDERGIRQGRFMGVFGKGFTLDWTEISAWAVGADVLVSHEYPQGRVLQWILELDHPRGSEVIRWGRSEEVFHAFATAVAERLPDEGRAPRVGQRQDARLPEKLARFAGLHREG